MHACDDSRDHRGSARRAGPAEVCSEDHGLDTSVGKLIKLLVSVIEVIQEPRVEAVIPQDPDDDKILGCAVASGARRIVSGDAHLLGVKRYRGISILTPKQFWDVWAKRSN